MKYKKYIFLSLSTPKVNNKYKKSRDNNNKQLIKLILKINVEIGKLIILLGTAKEQ